MANLVLNVKVAGAPPAGALAAGTGLAVAAYVASAFQLAPQRGQTTPTSAAASGTTDGSGNATLTGLSSVNYYLQVVDARGINNWYFVNSAWVGSGNTYQVNINWSTPTTTTYPIDARGGDTIGTNAGQLAWAPFTHVHQFSVAPAALTPITLPNFLGSVEDIQAVSDKEIHLSGGGLNITGFGFSGAYARTLDGGQSWYFVSPAGFTSSSVALATNGSTVLLASTGASNQGIAKSTNDGNTFSVVTPTGLTASVYCQDVAIVGSTWYALYIDTSGSPPLNVSQVVTTSNGGSTWTNYSLGQKYFVGDMAVDGTGNIIIVGGGIDGGSSYQVTFSTNAGSSWTTSVLGSGGNHRTTPVIINSTTWMAVVDDGSIWYTTNTGSTWTQISAGTTGFGTGAGIQAAAIDSNGRVALAGQNSALTAGQVGYMTSPPSGAVTLVTAPFASGVNFYTAIAASASDYWLGASALATGHAVSTFQGIVQP